jgi:hypothetical protein
MAAHGPGAGNPAASYVAFVDGLRLWLNDLMKSATQRDFRRRGLNGDGGWR